MKYNLGRDVAGSTIFLHASPSRETTSTVKARPQSNAGDKIRPMVYIYSISVPSQFFLTSDIELAALGVWQESQPVSSDVYYWFGPRGVQQVRSPDELNYQLTNAFREVGGRVTLKKQARGAELVPGDSVLDIVDAERRVRDFEQRQQYTAEQFDFVVRNSTHFSLYVLEELGRLTPEAGELLQNAIVTTTEAVLRFGLMPFPVELFRDGLTRAAKSIHEAPVTVAEQVSDTDRRVIQRLRHRPGAGFSDIQEQVQNILDLEKAAHPHPHPHPHRAEDHSNFLVGRNAGLLSSSSSQGQARTASGALGQMTWLDQALEKPAAVSSGETFVVQQHGRKWVIPSVRDIDSLQMRPRATNLGHVHSQLTRLIEGFAEELKRLKRASPVGASLLEGEARRAVGQLPVGLVLSSEAATDPVVSAAVEMYLPRAKSWHLQRYNSCVLVAGGDDWSEQELLEVLRCVEIIGKHPVLAPHLKKLVFAEKLQWKPPGGENRGRRISDETAEKKQQKQGEGAAAETSLVPSALTTEEETIHDETPATEKTTATAEKQNQTHFSFCGIPTEKALEEPLVQEAKRLDRILRAVPDDGEQAEIEDITPGGTPRTPRPGTPSAANTPRSGEDVPAEGAAFKFNDVAKQVSKAVSVMDESLVFPSSPAAKKQKTEPGADKDDGKSLAPRAQNDGGPMLAPGQEDTSASHNALKADTDVNLPDMSEGSNKDAHVEAGLEPGGGVDLAKQKEEFAHMVDCAAKAQIKIQKRFRYALERTAADVRSDQEDAKKKRRAIQVITKYEDNNEKAGGRFGEEIGGKNDSATTGVEKSVMTAKTAAGKKDVIKKTNTTTSKSAVYYWGVQSPPRWTKFDYSFETILLRTVRAILMQDPLMLTVLADAERDALFQISAALGECEEELSLHRVRAISVGSKKAAGIPQNYLVRGDRDQLRNVTHFEFYFWLVALAFQAAGARLTPAPASTVTVDDEDTDAKEHKRAEKAWIACGFEEIGRCWRDAVAAGKSARDVFTPSGWLTLRGGK